MILKIIGIVLLVILGILLICCLAVLFVPIRYKLNGTKEEDSNPKIKLRLSWLLHIISFYVIVEDGVSVKMKILGISIGSDSKNKKEKKAKKKKKKKTKSAKEKAAPVEKELPETEGLSQEKCLIEEDKAITEEQKKSQLGQESEEDTIIIEEVVDEESEEKKKDSVPKEAVVIEEKSASIRKFFDKLKEKLKRIKEAIYRLKSKIYSFLESLKNIQNRIISVKENIGIYKEKFSEKKNKIVDAWENKENKEAITFLKNIIKKIVCHILPKKWKGYIHFGFENPAQTGKTLGLISIFGGIIGVLPEIKPDFEKKVLEGEAMAKGRIYLFMVLACLIKIWRKKEVRHLVKQIKEL